MSTTVQRPCATAIPPEPKPISVIGNPFLEPPGHILPLLTQQDHAAVQAAREEPRPSPEISAFKAEIRKKTGLVLAMTTVAWLPLAVAVMVAGSIIDLCYCVFQ